jgi:heparin binding hemagglutinin HbhA
VIDMAKAKFDIKTEAQRTLHATVGAADLAFEAVKDAVSDAQKQLVKAQRQVKGFEFQPKVIRNQATTVVTSTVDELSKDAKARRDAIEKRVAALQTEAQKFVVGNVETATETYDDLVKRGEVVVKRIRRVPTSTPSNPANVKAPAAKKAPAKRTAANKTTAKKSVAKKSPAKKAATAS